MINWIRSVRVWFPKSLLFGNVGAQGLEEKWANPCQGKSFPSMLIKYLTPNSSAEGRKSCPVLCQHHLVTQNLKKPRKPLILWDLLVDVFFFFPFPLYLKHFPAFLQGHLVLSFSSFPLVPSQSVTVSSCPSVLPSEFPKMQLPFRGRDWNNFWDENVSVYRSAFIFTWKKYILYIHAI